MTPLNLEKALQLYDMLREYLPEDNIDELRVLDFIGTIVDNIADDNSTAYIDSLMLMSGLSLAELEGFSSEYLLEMFATGLIKNDIVNLRRFCNEINYG